MIKDIVITDFSKMPNGVCIYGYDNDYAAIRPVVFQENESPIGLPWQFVKDIRPLTKVRFDFIKKTNSARPHTEDWLINLNFPPQTIQILSDNEKINFLRSISFSSIEESCFGAKLNIHIDSRQRGVVYIKPGEGDRSIITINPKNIIFVEYSKDQYNSEKHNYRINFKGIVGADLKISDIAFRNYCDLLKQRGQSEKAIGFNLQKKINGNNIFLRIGAGRPFSPKNTSEEKCFLFVTGIYCFPDYK